MKTIKHNGKTIQISAPMERAIEHIARHRVVKASDLAEGTGRRTCYNIDIDKIPGTESAHRETVQKMPHLYPAFVVKFAKNNPRVERIVFDDRGKAKRIGGKL